MRYYVGVRKKHYVDVGKRVVSCALRKILELFFPCLELLAPSGYALLER